MRQRRAPHPGVLAGQQGNGRRFDGSGAARRSVDTAILRPQAHPCHAARPAAIIEPRRRIVAEPRRQDLLFPRSGRRFEPFQLLDHPLEGVRTFHPRILVDVLPRQQEAQEVARRHRLYLGPEALDSVAVDAGKQPTLAPFRLIGVGREPPSHREALRLEAGEGGSDFLARNAEGSSQLRLRDWPQALQPAAHDLHQGGFPRPLLPCQCRRRGERGFSVRLRARCWQKAAVARRRSISPCRQDPAGQRAVGAPARTASPSNPVARLPRFAQ